MGAWPRSGAKRGGVRNKVGRGQERGRGQSQKEAGPRLGAGSKREEKGGGASKRVEPKGAEPMGGAGPKRGKKGAEPHLIGPQDVVGGAQHHHVREVIAQPQKPEAPVMGRPISARPTDPWGAP